MDDVEDLTVGSRNLAYFVAATAGRKGHVASVHGGVAVASSYDVQNAYFTTAVKTDPDSSPSRFVRETHEFFSGLNRTFKLWVPTDDADLRATVIRVGGAAESNKPPAMSIRHRITRTASRFDGRLATNRQDFAAFGLTAEAGYGSLGLGWILQDQDYYAASGSFWAVAFDDEIPVGAACGFLHGQTGGIYFVGTPPEHRGRGVGAEITKWVANSLFDSDAECVTLQSSGMGRSVYEKLGFTVCGHYERFVFACQSPGEEARASS